MLPAVPGVGDGFLGRRVRSRSESCGTHGSFVHENDSPKRLILSRTDKMILLPNKMILPNHCRAQKTLSANKVPSVELKGLKA